jgi:predicted transcriptional regulator
METIITDAQKIQMVLDELGLSSYRLTQELNLSASAIYHVISGKNQLSMNLINKICTTYPEVNKKFLVKGIGEPIIEKTRTNDDEYVLVKRQNLDDIKKDIKILYELLQKLNDK